MLRHFCNTILCAISGSYWFDNPCDCDSLICNDTNHCEGGSPWMDDSVYSIHREWIPQEIMCGFGQKGNESIAVSITNTDSFHPTLSHFVVINESMNLFISTLYLLVVVVNEWIAVDIKSIPCILLIFGTLGVCSLCCCYKSISKMFSRKCENFKEFWRF